jgi:[ribosomal protein S18]-alanine N-acetyltransferase
MSDKQAELYTVEIEPMRDVDLRDVVALEHECGLSSRGVEKYRLALSDPRAVLLVAVCRAPAEEKRELVGMLSAIVVVDELQIDNIAVAEYWRRRGIASKLLRRGLSEAHQNGARSAVLEVRSRNLAARSLYSQLGFVVTGKRPAYYHDGHDRHDQTDDALTMSCMIERLITNQAPQN